MTNILKDMKIREVAFCRKGMNQHAKISLFKSSEAANAVGETMEEELKKAQAEFEKAQAELTEKLKKAEEALAEATELAKLSDEEKAFVEKMDAEGKKKFLGMSGEDKKKAMDAVKKNDETVVIAGQSISKSAVGDAAFAVMKAQAEQIEELRELAKAQKEAAEFAKFEKAATEYKHLPGTDVEKAKLLKAVAGTEAAAVLETILKAADSAHEKLFTVVGVKKSVVEGSAEDKVKKAVAELRKSDPKLTEEQAFSKALESDPALYEELNK